MVKSMFGSLTLLAMGVFCLLEARSSHRSDLPLLDSVSIDGITWKFLQKTPVGRFVNGDYYVVGNVTVSSVSPAPTPERNGSVLNLPVTSQEVSEFDSRVTGNRFTPGLRAVFPLTMKPRDALISSISLDTIGSIQPWLREGNGETPESPVKTVSILTCLSAPVSASAFRPSYCDRQQKIYYADSLQRGLLPSLLKVAGIPDIKTWAWHFRRPWLDVCFFAFDAPTEYQSQYGREVARSVGMGTLMLMCNFTAAEKESLLVNTVQYGIDLWGIARAGYNGWQAFGGHGSGRKWPIVFAGIMLGDTGMQSPEKLLPNIQFGEDMQTMYDKCWTGANVVYAGHQGVWKGKAVSSDPNWGPYEQLQPSQWPCDATEGCLGENYRRCCTSIAWVGEALAARILNAKKLWNHDAFFDYVDRWMNENDSAAVRIIKQQTNKDYSADWQRQGQCWDAFVQNMWKTYRASYPNNTLGNYRPKSFPKIVPSRSYNFFKSPGNGSFFDLSGRTASSETLNKSAVVLSQGPHKNVQKYLLLK